MLVEIGVVLASIIPVMVIGKAITIQIRRTPISVAIGQSLLGAIVGIVLWQFTSLVAIVAVGTAIAPLIINTLALIDKVWQKRKAMNGGYGDEVQWAAEMVEDGDSEFAFAVHVLPKHELREVGIIADSKEELRELAIERMEELADGQIPEDFA